MLKKLLTPICLITITLSLKGMEDDGDNAFLQKVRNCPGQRIEMQELGKEIKIPEKPTLTDEELWEQLDDFIRFKPQKEIIELLEKHQSFTQQNISHIIDKCTENYLDDVIDYLLITDHLKVKKADKRKIILEALNSRNYVRLQELEKNEANEYLKPYEDILKQFNLNTDEIKICIYYGINRQDHNGMYLLSTLIDIAEEFIKIGDIELILKFIRSTTPEDLNIQHRYDGSTALHDAVKKWEEWQNRPETGSVYNTLLNLSMTCDYEKIIFELLQHGADTKIKDGNNFSFEQSLFFNLHAPECKLRCLYYEYLQSTRETIIDIDDLDLRTDQAIEARLTNIDKNGERFLQQLIKNEADEELILAFIKNTTAEQLDAKDESQSTALNIALEKWERYFNEHDEQNYGDLMLKYHDIIIALLNHGANPNIFDTNNNNLSTTRFYGLHSQECQLAQAEYGKRTRNNPEIKKLSIGKIAAGIGLTVFGAVAFYLCYNWLNAKNVNNTVNMK